MDNPGGHGTIEAKESYTSMLKEKHNIRVVWQTPHQSPETNLLDLGIWCSLQSMVELSHQKKCKSNGDALARTIESVWQTFPAEKFQLVYERWQKVLKIICNTKGDNVKSDAYRGKSIVPEVNLDAAESNVLDIEEEINSDMEQIDDNQTRKLFFFGENPLIFGKVTTQLSKLDIKIKVCLKRSLVSFKTHRKHRQIAHCGNFTLFPIS